MSDSATAPANDGGDDSDTKMGGLFVCVPTPGVSMMDRILPNKATWKFLFMPRVKCMKPSGEPPFFKKDEKLPLVIALLMGLQHMLAMLGGIITTPKLIAGDACMIWQLDQELCDAQPQMVSATLIASGLLTIIQVMRWKLCGGLYMGTGLISVLGPSFAFLPIARQVVVDEINDADGMSGKDAYGAFLGTCIVASLFEILLGLLPKRFMSKIFPPIVCGSAVFLIGAALTGTGLKYWGGGVFCGENDLSRTASFGSPQSCLGDNGVTSVSAANGEDNVAGVDLMFGDPHYVGFGFLYLVTFILFETVGSPFVKNINVFLSLMIVYLISACVPYMVENPLFGTIDLETGLAITKTHIATNYATGYWVAKAEVFTFLWVETFNISFYPAAFLPLLLAFFVSSAETVGDITASCDSSRIPSTGPDAEARVQGGLLTDGISSFVAPLMMSTPNTTFSQNNGLIVITRCASRSAGLACAFWLIVTGIFGKFGGFVIDIPSCVLGGMATILFSNVMVSGLAVLSKIPFTRRNRIILAISLGIGLGIAAQPNFIEGGGLAVFKGAELKMNYGLWPENLVCLDNANKKWNTVDGTWAPGALVTSCEWDTGLRGWRSACILFLKTPYCIGTVLALILNLILPEDEVLTAPVKFVDEKQGLPVSTTMS